MIKEEKAQQGLDVKIVSCEDSYIYIDSAVKSLAVSICVNCNIFVASVSKICTIEKCENLIITVASNFLRVVE